MIILYINVVFYLIFFFNYFTKNLILHYNFNYDIRVFLKKIFKNESINSIHGLNLMGGFESVHFRLNYNLVLEYNINDESFCPRGSLKLVQSSSNRDYKGNILKHYL